VIGRGALGVAAALTLGWSLGVVMSDAPRKVAPVPSVEAAPAEILLSGPNAVRRRGEVPRRHPRARRRY
jgi:hypothetical protein